jgi:hypothetical protein
MSKVSGSSANAWWFNPQTGSATNFGVYATSGTQSFIPPDFNDWVLVLDDASVAVKPPGVLQVNTSWLPFGRLGVSYSQPLQGSGGTPPCRWSLMPGSDALPAGLSLAASGFLSGTPTGWGKADLVVQLTDSTNAKAIRILNVLVSSPPLLSVPPQTAAQIAATGFRFFVTADAPAVFTVEFTTDFVSWQSIGTLKYTSGQAQVIDPAASLSAPRFYRLRWP